MKLDDNGTNAKLNESSLRINYNVIQYSIKILLLTSSVSAYNVRLADRPKLITIASGDEFFLPDDSYYFWDQLDGTNYLQ